ncbi:hypothetical protein PIB30_087096 [Stylosanthes scabra]|uniref:Putative plant transposon protein domain-containing protein n=1 Tax=Stylosanthes scabra TaxID=79078 RepID=A0ABU6YSK1_9FABA|nr:hypothetical protein [Stylosanthes scabra]
MSSSSDMHDVHYFRSQFHQDLFEEHVASKSVTPGKSFDLQEDQYPEIQEQIANRGTKEEIASKEVYPYQSYVRGVTVDFSAKKIKQVLRIRDNTPGAQTTFDTRQKDDQRLDERQDLTPLARGWAKFIIYSIIPTENKSEVTVARAVLIHSIIKGDDVRVEELIADNIAITAEGVQGRSKLIFPSTIYRGKNINYQQHEEEEDQPEPMQQDENEVEHVYEDDNQEEQQDMHFEAPNVDFQNTFQEQQQQGFQQLNEQFSNMNLQ